MSSHNLKIQQIISRFETKKIANRKSSKNSFTAAIKNGKIKTVKLLVKQGADVNKPGSDGLTPLHVAAIHGRYMIMKLLIQNGAYVNSIFERFEYQKFTALYLAIQENHLKCVNVLLECGASVSLQIEGLRHPILLAVFHNNVKILRLLLNHGADVNCRFNNNFYEDFEPKLDRTLWFDHNLPLLHYAILCKYNEITDLLLASGADINLKTSFEKTTLMQAVEVNDDKLVKHLIVDRKINVNDRDSFGQPVLHFLMINANRKVSMYSKEESKMRFEKCRILRDLITHGADVNAKFPINENHSSVFHYMIKYGFLSGVGYLLHNSELNFNEIDFMAISSKHVSSQAVTLDVKKDQEYALNLHLDISLIKFAIARKVVNLKLIGLPVDERILLESPIDSIPEETWTNRLNLHRDQVMQEINYMKETKIGDSKLTVWYLLTCGMNELVKLMTNKNLRNVDVFSYCENMKMNSYNYTLKTRLRNAKNRIELLEKSIEFVSNLFINQLPFDCSEKIVNYLNYEELALSFSNVET